jgi:hypothetical protein
MTHEPSRLTANTLMLSALQLLKESYMIVYEIPPKPRPHVHCRRSQLSADLTTAVAVVVLAAHRA